MPYVPTKQEASRLRAAIDRASFTEGERIAWIMSFCAVLVLDAALIAAASWAGVVGTLGAAAILYWRLRGGYLGARIPAARDLHGMGLRSRQQRAFTALMLRHAFTGTNPLRTKPEHDPFGTWQRTLERKEADSSQPSSA